MPVSACELTMVRGELELLLPAEPECLMQNE